MESKLDVLNFRASGILRDEMSAGQPRRRRGRRPGNSGAREAILAAARAAFARDAYAGASLRAIAREADVDPALISHYFGSKAGLFIAATDWPFDPQDGVRATVAGGREEAGRRLAEFFFDHWSIPEKRISVLGLMQAAFTDPTVAALLREFFVDEVFEPMLIELGADQIPLRAGLLATQLHGIILSRYVLDVLSQDTVTDATAIAAIAPTLQRYALGELS
jgi:AcrR family transcriptional regulator